VALNEGSGVGLGGRENGRVVEREVAVLRYQRLGERALPDLPGACEQDDRRVAEGRLEPSLDSSP
jgi:hypothetical protein